VLLRCVAVLQLAKQQGDFLLVGLHTDEDVEARRGPHTPIMNVHERALSVLACKYVDEVRHQKMHCAALCSCCVCRVTVHALVLQEGIFLCCCVCLVVVSLCT
jgi:cytidyltransferase-like protein